MKKTSIYIEPEIDAALNRRAAAEGVTKAELIRLALQAATSNALNVKPKAQGAFSGPANLSETVDEQLTATGFGEQ
jgi:hypothetical protein